MRVKQIHAMRSMKSTLVAALAFVVLAVPTVVLADGRVALVVGNSTYAHIGRRPNTQNDAADVSAALRRLGFEVTTELDADRVEMTGCPAHVHAPERGSGRLAGLLRGARQDGVNYLVPVDACLERDVDVRFETVTLNDLLVSTVGASLRLVILDACRNNPLARSMLRTAASRSVSGGSFGDLNEDLLGDETLLAYAAAAGTTAADGRDRNSPYTSALLSHLETPLEFLRRQSAVAGEWPTGGATQSFGMCNSCRAPESPSPHPESDFKSRRTLRLRGQREVHCVWRSRGASPGVGAVRGAADAGRDRIGTGLDGTGGRDWHLHRRAGHATDRDGDGHGVSE